MNLVIFDEFIRGWDKNLHNLKRSITINNMNNMPKENNIMQSENIITDITNINISNFNERNISSSSSTNIVKGYVPKPQYHDPLIDYYKSVQGTAYTRHQIDSISYYRCLYCQQYMKTFTAVCNHINKHRNVTPYKCNLCSCQYTTKNVLNRHFNKKHNTNINATTSAFMKCPICDTNFTDKQYFYEHLTTNHADRPQAIDGTFQSNRSQGIEETFHSNRPQAIEGSYPSRF